MIESYGRENISTRKFNFGPKFHLDRPLIIAIAYFFPFSATLIGSIFLYAHHEAFLYGHGPGMMTGFGINWSYLSWRDLWALPILGSGAPLLLFHHPAYFFQALVGVTVALAGAPDAGINLIVIIAGGLQMLLLVPISLWLAGIARVLKLSAIDVGLLALAMASFPAALHLAPIISAYFPTAFMLPAAGLGLLAFVIDPEQNRGQLAPALFISGFCIANLFAAVPAIVAAVIALLFVSHGQDLTALAASMGRVRWHQYLIALILLALMMMSLTGAVSHASIYRGGKFMIILAVLALAGAVALIGLAHRLIWLRGLLFGIGTPLLAGWLIGCNLLFGYWGLSAVNAAASKGTARADLWSLDAYRNFAIFELAGQFSWLWFLFLALAVAVLCTGWAIFDRKRESRFVAYFVVVGLILTFFAAGDLLSGGQNENSILSLRFLFGALGFIVVALAWLLRSNGWIASAARLVIATLACLSILDFVPIATRDLAGAAADADRLAAMTARFLAEHPDGTIVCAGIDSPGRCAVANLRAVTLTEVTRARIGPASGTEPTVYIEDLAGCRTRDGCPALAGVRGRPLLVLSSRPIGFGDPVSATTTAFYGTLVP